MRCRWIGTAVLAATVALSACGRGSEDPGDPLAKVLLSDTPRGYELVDGPSGPMDLDAASSATTVAQGKVRRQLSRTGFQGGYSRVWQRSEDFVALLVFDFISGARAQEFVSFQAAELEGFASTQPFTVSDLEGARGFILSAAKPRERSALFCQIVWFAQGTWAFEVRTCGDQPTGATQAVSDMAARQADHARGAA